MQNKSQSAIEFCKKWNVYTKNISHEKFIKKVRSGELCALIPYTESNNLNINSYDGNESDLRALKYLGNQKFDNIIYFSDKFKGNYESILIHELVHILLKVNPKYLNEFKSPFTSLWDRFIKLNNVNVKFLQNEENKNNFIKTLADNGPRGHKLTFNSYEEYIESNNQKLINNGLLDVNLNPTYDYSKVIPEQSWKL